MLEKPFEPCACCGCEDIGGQWWYLTRYLGIFTGRFCPECYHALSKLRPALLKALHKAGIQT